MGLRTSPVIRFMAVSTSSPTIGTDEHIAGMGHSRMLRPRSVAARRAAATTESGRSRGREMDHTLRPRRPAESARRTHRSTPQPAGRTPLGSRPTRRRATPVQSIARYRTRRPTSAAAWSADHRARRLPAHRTEGDVRMIGSNECMLAALGPPCHRYRLSPPRRESRAGMREAAKIDLNCQLSSRGMMPPRWRASKAS